MSVDDVCRLCLSKDNLIWVFDKTFNNVDNMRDVIFITTGVEIFSKDVISQKICSKCSQISVKMLQFRNHSLKNDQYLKEQYNKMLEKTKIGCKILNTTVKMKAETKVELKQVLNQVISKVTTEEETNKEAVKMSLKRHTSRSETKEEKTNENKHEVKSDTPKTKPTKTIIKYDNKPEIKTHRKIHPSINDLFKMYPQIMLPSSCLIEDRILFEKMKRNIGIWIFVLFCVVKSDETPPQIAAESAVKTTEESEKKLSETILKILEHYKQPDPIGLPGAPIPDPMDIPEMKQSFSVGRMTFKNVKLYGLKKFRIDHILADITEMKVEAALTIDVLDVKGNYTLSTWFSKAHGPFTVKLTKVKVIAIASMKVEVNGTLEAQDMDMDIMFKEIAMDFQGLGFFASMFQGIMNSVGTFVFDSIKPFVLSEANTNLRSDINKEIQKFPKKFPNSISPFDQLICEVRRKVINMGFDPYQVPDYNNSAGIFDVFLTHTWVYGLSSFHRTRDIKFEMKNNTVHTLLEVGTGVLRGTSNWEVSLVAGLVSKVGTVSFSINYIRVQINVSQSMDTSKSPVMDDIQVELGNIQVRFNGLGTIDYGVELGVNVLPNLLRYQIMDALEKPLKQKIQEALDQVNVESFIIENADKIDNASDLDDLQFL